MTRAHHPEREKVDRQRIRSRPLHSWSQATSEVAETFVLAGKEEPKQQRRLGKAPVSAGDARVAPSMCDPRLRRCESELEWVNGRVCGYARGPGTFVSVSWTHGLGTCKRRRENSLLSTPVDHIVAQATRWFHAGVQHVYERERPGGRAEVPLVLVTEIRDRVESASTPVCLLFLIAFATLVHS